MWETDGEKEKQNSLSVSKRGRAGDVRVDTKSLLWIVCPPTLGHDAAHAATEGHVWVRCHAAAGSVSMPMAHITIKTHAAFPGLVCCLGPY